MEKHTTTAKSKITRRNYSRISGSLELPNLVEIQTNSYKWFKEVGIKEVFDDIYPITNFNETLSLEFVDCAFDEPKYSVNESKDRDANYAAPIRATLRLINSGTGEIKEQEVFMGDFPLMTDSGTFIINGAERVIVSQLVRSPGAYFADAIDKSGKTVFEGSIIPSRGTWLEFENDAKDVLNVRIDRNRKIPGTVLLRALGLSSNEDIIDVFGDHEFILNTLAKDNTTNTEEALIEIYNKLRPGEPATLEGATSLLYTRFFDPKRYDLAKAGRFKFKKKLSLLDRIAGRVLAEDVKDVDGNVVCTKGTVITNEVIDTLRPVFEAGAHTIEMKTNPRLESNGVLQVVHVYVDESRTKVMKVIGTDLSLNCKYVTISDMIAAYSYMSLVPIIQPPIMKLLTTKEEREVKMEQLRPVSKLEKILFPIVVTIVVVLILPTTAPLVGMLMLGNLFRESGVVKQLTETASNALMYIVVIILGTSVGATTSAEAFLNLDTLKIVALGLIAFAFGTAAGVVFGKIMCKVTHGKVNPLIGSAGVSAVPMAARVSQKVGSEADPSNFLLMHAMGPNVAGVIGTAVAAGTFMAMFGVM